MEQMTVVEVDELLNMCCDCLEKYPDDKRKIFTDIDELLDLRLSITSKLVEKTTKRPKKIKKLA